MSKEQLERALIGFLQDAYAMEQELTQVLRRQVDLMVEQPKVQARISQHLAETELQRKRMQQRLEAYKQTPSMVREAASTVMGNVTAIAGVLRTDPLFGTLRDDYVTEQQEIALYTRIIAVAKALGDQVTARAAEETRQEEIAMAEWLFDHLEIAAYADLQALGINIPDRSIEEAREAPAMRVSIEPLKAKAKTKAVAASKTASHASHSHKASASHKAASTHKASGTHKASATHKASGTHKASSSKPSSTAGAKPASKAKSSHKH